MYLELSKPEGGMPGIPPSERFTWETSMRSCNCCYSHRCSRNRSHSCCRSRSRSHNHRNHNRSHSHTHHCRIHRRSSSTER